MKQGERGFAYLDLIVAVAIMALVSLAASAATFQILKGTERNNEYVTVVRQVQNAGYWISRDIQMAHTATAENLTLPDFLVLRWTDWANPDDPVYHSITYFFEDLTDGTGKLKRNHWSSAGANENTLVAEYIYYDPDDINNTTKASYQSPELTVQITALFEEARETKEYKITQRPNF